MSLTAIAFVISYVTGLLAGLFRHPAFAFYTYIAVFYLHPKHRWWGGDLATVRWSLIAAVVTIIAVMRIERRPDREPWMSSGAIKITFLFVAWFWLQSLWALDPEMHRTGAILLTKYIVLFYVMYRLLDSEKAVYDFFAVHVLGCMYLGWLVLQSNVTGRLDGIGGPGIDTANALSMHLITGMMCAGVLFLRGPLSMRVLAVSAMPLMGNAFIQAQTRGSLVGLAMGGLTFVYLLPKASRKLVYVMGVLAMVAMLELAPSGFWERMQSIVIAAEEVTGIDVFDFPDQVEEEQEIDGASETRVDLARAQWDFFKWYPLGTGHRGTVVLTNDYFTARGMDHGTRASHNTFLTVLSEQGLPGAILFFAMVFWVGSSLRKLKRYDAQGLPVRLGYLRAAIGGSLVSTFFCGMFADFLKVEVLIWCLTALVILQDIVSRWELGLLKTPEPEPDSDAVVARVETPVRAARISGAR